MSYKVEIRSEEESLNRLEFDSRTYMGRKLVFALRLLSLIASIIFFADAYLLKMNAFLSPPTNDLLFILFIMMGIFFFIIYLFEGLWGRLLKK